MKRVVLSLVLLATPLAAWADCTAKSEQQAMSCAEGTAWDQEANACLPVASS